MEKYLEELYKTNIEILRERGVRRPHSIVQEVLVYHFIKKYGNNIKELKVEYPVRTVNDEDREIEWYIDVYLKLKDGTTYIYEVKTRPRYDIKDFKRRKMKKMILAKLLNEEIKDAKIIFVIPNGSEELFLSSETKTPYDDLIDGIVTYESKINYWKEFNKYLYRPDLFTEWLK